MFFRLQTILRRPLFLLLFGALFADAAHAAIIVRPWVPIFKGVEYAACEADAAEPRLQKVYAMRINLSLKNGF